MAHRVFIFLESQWLKSHGCLLLFCNTVQVILSVRDFLITGGETWGKNTKVDLNVFFFPINHWTVPVSITLKNIYVKSSLLSHAREWWGPDAVKSLPMTALRAYRLRPHMEHKWYLIIGQQIVHTLTESYLAQRKMLVMMEVNSQS